MRTQSRRRLVNSPLVFDAHHRSSRGGPSAVAAAQDRPMRKRLRDEDGAATAEYAIATLAAVGFAGLLVAILRSDEVRGLLLDLVHRALTVGS
jgi:Flp pilus assembly pilin Flp